MRFLIDHDVYYVTTSFLAGLGHDVVTVSELNMHQSTDVEILQLAQAQSRIMVTRDRDYGSLVFVSEYEIGVLYLRILPTTIQEVHAEVERVLALYAEDQLLRSF